MVDILQPDWSGINFTFFVQFTICSVVLFFLIFQSRKKRDFSNCEDSNCFRCSHKKLLKKISKEIASFNGKNNENKTNILQALMNYHQELKQNSVKLPVLHIFKDTEAMLQTNTSNMDHDISLLESNLDVLLKEYKEISEEITEDSGWKINNTPSGKWCIFPLINQGNYVFANTAKCQSTFAILKNLNNIMSDVIFGNACFSIIFPKTEIMEHCGPCTRARCHLGLITPPGCSITINNIKYGWDEGKCLIFDDSHPHSVIYNAPDSQPPRVVLMIDFWHPLLTKDDKNALKTILKS